MSDEKLKRCPFCGGEAKEDFNMFGDYIVVCTNCPAEIKPFGCRNRGYVNSLWNRRCEPDERRE